MLSDVEELYSFLSNMHAEIGVARLDREKALARIAQVVQGGGALVIEDGGRMVASVGIEETSAWYSNEKAYYDTWFYVHHDHRKSGHAKALLYFVKQASKVRGIPVVISVGTTKDTLRKLRFFRKYMTPFGGSFIYGI